MKPHTSSLKDIYNAQTEEKKTLIMPLGLNTDQNLAINKIKIENGEINGKSYDHVEVRLVFKRWLVLFIFASISMMSAFNWIEYNIIQDIVVNYYNESLPEGKIAQNEAVNWMSMIYMITYIPLVFPAMFLLDLKGLRLCCTLGALLTCVGSWVKCAGISPNRFVIAFIGQTICAIAQAFTLGVPARLSSLWFGNNEISTATSIGVFGNQFGTALGFLIPPSVIPNNGDIDMVTIRFYYLLITVAILCTVLFTLALLVIRDHPPHPPNYAQIDSKQDSLSFHDFKMSLLNLLKNPNFLLILISYGINTGSYYSISTLLNQTLISHYAHENEKIGFIGLILVLSGLIGAIIGGIILDRTKAFKWTTFGMYACSLASMVLFTSTLYINIWIIFGTAFLLGFFMTGYLPVGFEFAAELTYPEPEGTSSGLLNASSQVFGIAFIYAQSYIMAKFSAFYSNIFLCTVLLVGTFLTAIIKNHLKRQATIKYNESNHNILKSQINKTDNLIMDNAQNEPLEEKLTFRL